MAVRLRELKAGWLSRDEKLIREKTSRHKQRFRSLTRTPFRTPTRAPVRTPARAPT